MIKIFKIERLHLLIQTFKGKIHIKDFYNLAEKNDIKSNLKDLKIMLGDIREAEFEISVKEFKDFIKQQDDKKHAKNAKHIILSEKPKTTALAEVFTKEYKKIFEGKVFFELNSALNYISLEDEKDEILKYIDI